MPEETFTATFRQFNDLAGTGVDTEFDRGASAYDRYYGDPTVSPNPNLAALAKAPYYAVKMADEHARVLREDGSAIDGLYAIGNTAANAFGATYPGAGATIGQGLVYGYIAAQHAAQTRGDGG
ncbi:succinate dehydrogenase/fumarate reductase flavoprotein subunit [Mycobacteroides abscessus subsp. abscessus]|nr:succinate dehydrogenase/fumarate reductase flavoprotein subunit [Mycobacteroides abscessus subsp. abscessus]